MISIIIPVFNEVTQIGHLLHYLKYNSTGLVKEIIVVDGGSTDGTCNLLQQDTNINVLPSKKGRAKQMNEDGEL